MKRIFTLLVISMIGSSVCDTLQAQNVYWREDFTAGTSTGPTSDPAASTTVNDFTSAASGNAVWKFYGLWLTTGTACEGQGVTGSNGINRHVRSTSNTGLVDTAYLITPEVNFGINTLMFYRSRSNRGYTIWTNTMYTIDPMNSGWSLAAVVQKRTGFPNPLCVDSIININRPTAKALMIRFEKAVNSDIDSVVMTSTTPIMPVKYSGISAALSNGMVKVTWNVASEINTSKYVVEKSTDGIKFNAAGEVAANNDSRYSWIDNAPTGTKVYYRIKAVDKDGTPSFSTVVSVNLKSKGAEFIVAPNPVKGNNMNIQLNNYEKGVYMLSVVNSAGQTLFGTKVNNEGGYANQTITLPSTVVPGIYNVVLTNGNSRTTKSIVVQ